MNERVLQDIMDLMQVGSTEAAESAGIILADFLKELYEDVVESPTSFFLNEMLIYAREELP